MCSTFGVVAACPVRRRSIFFELEKGLRHRGPDGLRTYSFEDAMIGNHSLSLYGTVDYPAEAGFTAVSFNGQIYNAKELVGNMDGREELEAIKYCPASALNGPFAVAMYDTRFGDVVFKRDRLGEKPLYYFWKDGVLAWASEQTALASAVGAKNKPSVVMENFYATETAWEDIEEVPPGHTVHIDPRQSKKVVKRFWRMPAVDDQMTFVEAVEGVRGFLTKASERVFLHSLGNAPSIPAVLCSGGVDSSIVTTIIKASDKISESAAHWRPAYCMDIRADVEAAREVGHNARGAAVKVINQGVLPSEYDVDAALGEPNTDPGNVLFMKICKDLKRDGVRCFIGGDGGDDLFLGYPWHTKALRRGQPVDREAALRNFSRNILMRADRIAGSMGMEARTPFTDIGLVDFALTIPDRLQLDTRLPYPGKTVLCAAFQNIVPPQVLTKEKSGLCL